MLIWEMTEVTEEVVGAFQRLIPQLTRYCQPPTQEALEKLARSPDTVVFLARLSPESPAIGSATLIVTASPTGRHGWIEDVIVDEAARGRGVGKALTLTCLEKARGVGLSQVNLTSRPGRVAANRMYQSLGFVLRETNVYCFDLT